MNNREIKKASRKPDHSSTERDVLTDLFSRWRERIRNYSVFAAAGAMLTSAPPELNAQDATDQSGSRLYDVGLVPMGRSRRAQFFRSFDQQLTATPEPPYLFPSLTGTDDCPGTQIPQGNYTATSPYVDTGDTTAANNTVTQVIPYYTYNAAGPDRIYSFVITSIGPNPEIKVTTTSPTYKPMIYVSDLPCPAGTGATLTDWAPNRRWLSTHVADARWAQDNTARIGEWAFDEFNAFYFGRRQYLYIDSRIADEAGPYTLTIKDIRISSSPKVERHARPDFDGDGLSDFAVFRPSNSTWYVNRSTQGFSSIQWGLPTDTLVPEDYDGDGKTDVAVYRGGEWHILGSSQGYMSAQWGSAGDIPVPADFTGDGNADLAIYRGGTWWIHDLTTGTSDGALWGLPGDRPVPMDYDSDGKADFAVYRDGTWHIYRSRRGPAAIRWGVGSDKVVPGYFGPHNQADFSIYRGGAWYTLLALWYWDVNGYLSMQWGGPTDTPVAGNFFNVWAADAGVFRDGAWWMRDCAGDLCSGRYVVQFGQAGDIPISGVYNR